MKKVKTYKGFVFATSKKDEDIHIFTKEEWSMGQGCRYEEHYAQSIEEAQQFVDSY